MEVGSHKGHKEHKGGFWSGGSGRGGRVTLPGDCARHLRFLQSEGSASLHRGVTSLHGILADNYDADKLSLVERPRANRKYGIICAAMRQQLCNNTNWRDNNPA